ncbi:MAG: hypothetical protein KDC46_02905 [Thermoleophilia bacterium]|nr:hypothetical protein [Thermoleophilia bacterium]
MHSFVNRVGSPRLLGTVVIAAWAMYFTMISLSNIFDALKAMDVLGNGFDFASGNWSFMQDTVAIYGTPDWLTGILFAGAIVLEVAVAALCWYALGSRLSDSPVASAASRAAVTSALVVWTAFVFMEEIFIAYGVESTHWMLFVASAISFGLLYLVDRPRELAQAGERGGADEAERRVLDVRRHVLVRHGEEGLREREHAAPHN